jgi:hypothetical protein
MNKTTSRKYKGNKIQAAKPLKMRISKSKPIFRVRVMVLNATFNNISLISRDHR